MKLYVVTTGAAFALLALVHVARLVFEGTGPLAEPTFVIATLVSLAFVAWAIMVLRGS